MLICICIAGIRPHPPTAYIALPRLLYTYCGFTIGFLTPTPPTPSLQGELLNSCVTPAEEAGVPHPLLWNGVQDPRRTTLSNPRVITSHSLAIPY